MWLLQLVLKAAIFFTLFAFALNNQHEAVVHFFFGTAWQAPMVLVVLLAFVMGVVIGVMGMVPRWWRQRRVAQQSVAQQTQPDRGDAPPTQNTRNVSPEDPPHGI